MGKDDGMRIWLRAFLILWLAGISFAEEARWFPKQSVPKGLVRAVADGNAGAASAMMVQSVAGLAAKAVNEGRGDEMVWVANGNADIERWYAGHLAQFP